MLIKDVIHMLKTKISENVGEATWSKNSKCNYFDI